MEEAAKWSMSSSRRSNGGESMVELNVEYGVS